ncbi:hypothetical protein ACTHP3_00360 [Shouchella rhizosphaerae]|uniref:hypothetical protein n=1 Tax=Shouchella rhizosphaerae TaxID=866786 RepID=UPI003F817E5B
MDSRIEITYDVFEAMWLITLIDEAGQRVGKPEYYKKKEKALQQIPSLKKEYPDIPIRVYSKSDLLVAVY